MENGSEPACFTKIMRETRTVYLPVPNQEENGASLHGTLRIVLTPEEYKDDIFSFAVWLGKNGYIKSIHNDTYWYKKGIMDGGNYKYFSSSELFDLYTNTKETVKQTEG